MKVSGPRCRPVRGKQARASFEGGEVDGGTKRNFNLPTLTTRGLGRARYGWHAESPPERGLAQMLKFPAHGERAEATSRL
jgi:hypothetical protein